MSRSLPSRAVKRKSEDEGGDNTKKSRYDEEVEEEEVASIPAVLSYRWIDGGATLQNGQVEHKLLEAVVNGKSTMIAVGDTITLRSSHEMDDEDAFVAKVERMWQAPVRKNQIKEHCMKLRARWYFKKLDIQELRGTLNGPLSKQQLLASMSDKDLVLSNQYDDNDVLTLLDKCTVVNRRPSEEVQTPDLPKGVWVSKFSIHFGENAGTALLVPYDGENQPWPTPSGRGSLGEAHESPSKDVANVDDSTRPTMKRDRSDDDDDTFESADSSLDDDIERRLTEGTNTKGKIVVGPEHQAVVEPFHVVHGMKSRNPTLIWNAGSSVDTNRYFEAAGKVLYKYLADNRLMTEDPYFPLPHEQMEELLREQKLSTMTLSNLSTGSSMSTQRNKLTRECKVDALIELLHNKDYNIKEALSVIKAAPQDYITIWTRVERDLFNTGFRRYAGSLRMIASNAMTSKNFKDIVDYHYRFKIPDQFRRYQDKKREHAMRMIDIIEDRRKDDASIVPRDENRRRSNSDIPNSKHPDWTKTSMSEVVGVVEYRRTSAKDLLMDIQQAVGTEKLGLIAEAIKNLHERSIGELKEQVEKILQNHPALLDRFLDYLPRKFRS